MNNLHDALDKLQEFTSGETQQEKRPRKKWWLLLIIIVAFFIIVALGIVGVMVYEIKYKYSFFPGSRVGNISLGGLSVEQGLDQLTPLTDKIEKEGIKISYNGELRTLNFVSAGSLSDPDLSREVLAYDEHKTIYDAFDIGHGNSFFRSVADQWDLLWGGTNFKVHYYLDEEALMSVLREEFGKYDVLASDAKPKITWSGDSYKIEIEKENAGKVIDFKKAVADIKNNLDMISSAPITLTETISQPQVTVDQISGRTSEIDAALAGAMPEFSYEKENWKMDKKKLSTMLEFHNNNGSIELGLNKEIFEKWFAENISAKIDVEPKNAQIDIKDGQATKISTHQTGLKADVDKAYADAQSAMLVGGWPVAVAVNKIEPEVVTDNINDLGIKEIIGFGESNFSGSPSNRIHNIKNGASKVHGILIKPGEEFSLIKTLGEVEKHTGYLPELVIKGNKTLPEYGGGLCQVGTTVFRAAMGSGLPITERRNHSYSVGYYLENGLPGVDATIYIPHPDVRFVNDTGNYILIQARVEGTKLKFEFWGTKDGRKSERTKPKVWDWVSPAPTKMVETTDLKPGVKKCTESSHKGVKASFDYIVTTADGEVKKQNFYSVYKPWQAVCLIGIDPSKASSTDATAGGAEMPASTTAETN